jgi:methionyl-tRNA formyltransferase
MPRILFMGSPDFAVPSLLALLADPHYEVVGVVTQPDKPAGRGQKLTACAVKAAAEARGLKVLTPTKLRPPEVQAELAALAPELIVVAAYGRILPKAILELPAHGCINVHASLLPRHRGASPIAHAILAGDREAGVAIMRMEEGLDTGPVYARRAIAIAADDTTGSLSDKLAALGAELLVATLPTILSGSLQAEPQSGDSTYAPLFEKEHGAIDFARPASELERHIRAMQPWPGAFTNKGAVRLQVLQARLVKEAHGEAGRVLAADATGILVGCGSEGALLLTQIKPAGKGAMSAAAWVAGRQVAVGDLFGPHS